VPTASFNGLRVLTLESRRAPEMVSLITTYGGRAIAAPALREVPLESNHQALDFAARLVKGEFDVVVLLTGVGTRVLLAVVERAQLREAFVTALAGTKVVPRGPKPLAVLRELQITPWLTVPEPNTWRELLAAIDVQVDGQGLRGVRVAVQEYGVENPELLKALEERGASVTRVPVYQWALPEDLEPLREAVRAITRGDVDVVLFTTATQVTHLVHVAGEMDLESELLGGLGRLMIASIGPTTSEALRRQGLEPDLEPSHPKMGFLVKEAAERSGNHVGKHAGDRRR
jgi:uroporphyrinogen-III synthase